MPAEQPDDDDDRDGPPGDDAEHLGQRVELALQRRPGARHRGEHRRDLAHLGLHAGRRDDDGRGAAGDRGVLEQHVGAVAQPDVRGGQRAGILGDRRALAGQRGLLRLERRRPHDPPVGGHDVAGLDLHDVARHDVGGRDQQTPPPRTTRACGTCILDSASTLARAVSS